MAENAGLPVPIFRAPAASTPVPVVADATNGCDKSHYEKGNVKATQSMEEALNETRDVAYGKFRLFNTRGMKNGRLGEEDHVDTCNDTFTELDAAMLFPDDARVNINTDESHIYRSRTTTSQPLHVRHNHLPTCSPAVSPATVRTVEHCHTTEVVTEVAPLTAGLDGKGECRSRAHQMADRLRRANLPTSDLTCQANAYELRRKEREEADQLDKCRREMQEARAQRAQYHHPLSRHHDREPERSSPWDKVCLADTLTCSGSSEEDVKARKTRRGNYRGRGGKKY